MSTFELVYQVQPLYTESLEHLEEVNVYYREYAVYS